jgi:hypothetical protein
MSVKFISSFWVVSPDCFGVYSCIVELLTQFFGVFDVDGENDSFSRVAKLSPCFNDSPITLGSIDCRCEFSLRKISRGTGDIIQSGLGCNTIPPNWDEPFVTDGLA